MTCREMDLLLSSGAELPPEARRHLAQCTACRGIAAAFAVPAAPCVRASLPETIEPVQPLASPAVFAILLALAAAILAAGAAAWKGILGPPLLSPLQKASIFGVLLILLAVAAGVVALDMRPGARSLRGATLFVLAFGAMEAVFFALFHDYRAGSFLQQGLRCFSMGIACAAATALLTWLIVRRGYLVAPVSAGAAAGVLAGLAGLATLELHCPIQYVPHLVVWHAGVVVASAATGALIGKLAHFSRHTLR